MEIIFVRVLYVFCDKNLKTEILIFRELNVFNRNEKSRTYC